jgi:hypothetical protein
MKLWTFFRENYLPKSFLQKEKRNIALTFVFITFIMLLLEYYGWQGPFLKHAKHFAMFRGMSHNQVFFCAQAFTTISFLTLFFLLPLGFHYCFPLENSNPFGLRKFKIKESLILYGPLVLIMIPVLWIACGQESFYKFYPLYKPTSIKGWLVFEAVYMLQFFSVEFFFRGFGLFRLEKHFPGYGLFMMTLPYALIHIHKPFGEAIGSIFAGLVLGRLALKGGSIWPGVMVHCSIAFSADFFSLIHSGRFAQLGW